MGSENTAKGKTGKPQRAPPSFRGLRHKTTTRCVCSPDQTEARRQATTQASQHIAGRGGLPFKKQKKNKNPTQLKVGDSGQHVFSLIWGLDKQIQTAQMWSSEAKLVLGFALRLPPHWPSTAHAQSTAWNTVTYDTAERSHVHVSLSLWVWVMMAKEIKPADVVCGVSQKRCSSPSVWRYVWPFSFSQRDLLGWHVFDFEGNRSTWGNPTHVLPIQTQRKGSRSQDLFADLLKSALSLTNRDTMHWRKCI